jgi:hypothetical protein
MRSVDDIFQDLGGTGAVAKLLDVGHSTASEMRRRGSIPVRYWPKLVSEAAACGVEWITNDNLVEMHAREAAA